jgi:uncharacterized protein with HEPN domain
MAAKDPRLYLLHIQECCEKILSYTKDLGTVARFARGGGRGAGIWKSLGEAASKLDPEFRQIHAEVPGEALSTRGIW